MQKILEIDGKNIVFKSTGATPIKYKREFGRDFFSDLFKMNEIGEVMSSKSKKNSNVDFDMDVFYNIIWILAKGGDSNIPPLEEWLESFDSFPIVEIISELNDLLIASIQRKK